MKTRPILFSENATLHPNKCMFCGVSNRRWFIDLGIDIAVDFNAGLEGVLYVCCECIDGTINDLIAITNRMDNTDLPESTYNEFEALGLGRGPELPIIPEHAPSDPIPDGTTGFGAVQELGSNPNIIDNSFGASSDASVGPDDAANDVDNDAESETVSGLIFDLTGGRD